MQDPTHKLKDLKPEQDFFVGIDSDGCVFDSMEIKHKECFCPNFINHFELQPVSKFAREAWDFVNLYSKTRGVNRFQALIHALDLLRVRKEVLDRGANIPELQGVRDWIARETKLGNPALKNEVEKHAPHPDLVLTYAWSFDVNEAVKKIVRNVPPFPLVKECLEKINQKADSIVVSQTPFDTLEREWTENKIDHLVRLIAGQEMGTKTEHISLAAKGKYPSQRILMIGDAPGDLKAARANEALFYPIIPGREEESWKRLTEEALDKFFSENYAGEYENQLVEKFNQCLPERAPWEP
ncbi:MAG: HAD hydrolase-like protein [Spirochaetales bacterium]|nr:HAD hydrolase-like protein [Spirochaetales bacterium]